MEIRFTPTPARPSDDDSRITGFFEIHARAGTIPFENQTMPFNRFWNTRSTRPADSNRRRNSASVKRRLNDATVAQRDNFRASRRDRECSVEYSCIPESDIEADGSSETTAPPGWVTRTISRRVFSWCSTQLITPVASEQSNVAS